MENAHLNCIVDCHPEMSNTFDKLNACHYRTQLHLCKASNHLPRDNKAERRGENAHHASRVSATERKRERERERQVS